MTASIFEQFLSTPEIGAVFSDAAIVQGMLDFEAALAHAQAAEGVIPARAAPLLRCRQRLVVAAQHELQLQLVGAVGTLSVMGDKGPAVAQRMAAELGLGLAPGNWHTQRDEWVALGCEVGVLCGVLGKIAKD